MTNGGVGDLSHGLDKDGAGEPRPSEVQSRETPGQVRFWEDGHFLAGGAQTVTSSDSSAGAQLPFKGFRLRVSLAKFGDFSSCGNLLLSVKVNGHSRAIVSHAHPLRSARWALSS